MLLFCSSSGQNGGGHPHISQGTAAHPGNWVWAATNEITFDAFIIKRHNGTLYAKVAFCDSQQVLLTVTFPKAVIYLMGILPTGALTTGEGDWISSCHQRGRVLNWFSHPPPPNPCTHALSILSNLEIPSNLITPFLWEWSTQAL